MSKEIIANVTVSLMKDMELKDVDNILMVFTKLYAGVAEIIGETYNSSNPAVARDVRVMGQTEGGRRMPIVSQEEIQAKINAAQVGRMVSIRSAQAEALPTDVIKWAQDNGGEYVVDNAEAKSKNPKSPDYKLVDANGNDIRTSDGKSVAFWQKAGK